MLKNKEDFFKEYNIDEEQFEKCTLNWGDLEKIYLDYEKKKLEFEPTAKDY
ncbi:hypothetical protein [Flammeovirga sp. SJP92]|uniref:hypothetical protein n=1 Tax=Flammeovirga sp. SJP92 TaxID=1775430 RepID=UPI0012FCE5E4|nr:hypothetical protein [Flammeovirga sp. SJP92]